MHKKVLIICYNTLHNDPRILRQIRALKNEYEIITAGYSDSKTGVAHVQLKSHVYRMIDFFFNYPFLIRKFFAALTQLYLRTAKLRAALINFVLKLPFLKPFYYERQYWTDIEKENYNQLKKLKVDLILANDIHALPLAVKLKTQSVKLVFDAHEYHPEELAEIEEWRKNIQPKVKYQCDKYISKADVMFTVSEPIADEYEKNYGVKPIVVTNAPPFIELNPVKPRAKIELIHHGGAVKERLLEETINVVNYLNDDYTLNLMLVSSDNVYLNYLKEKYKNNPKVNFLDPVPTTEIALKINKYDIGIYILPPLNFNNINALPNKFFEFIQARLAIAIAPMPAMSKVVNKYNIGVVAKDYTSKALAESIQKMSGEDIYKCKLNSNLAAEQLSSEANEGIILEETKKLLN